MIANGKVLKIVPANCSLYIHIALLWAYNLQPEAKPPNEKAARLQADLFPLSL